MRSCTVQHLVEGLAIIVAIMVIVVVAMGFLHFLVALLALAHRGALSVLTVETLEGTHLAVVGGATVEVDEPRELYVYLVGALTLS